MEYHTAMRKNKLKPTWINLKNLTLNRKVSHKKLNAVVSCK